MCRLCAKRGHIPQCGLKSAAGRRGMIPIRLFPLFWRRESRRRAEETFPGMKFARVQFQKKLAKQLADRIRHRTRPLREMGIWGAVLDPEMEKIPKIKAEPARWEPQKKNTGCFCHLLVSE